MAVIKKSDMKKFTEAEVAAKIAELERAQLELSGEGNAAKAKPLKKAIAKLKAKLNTLQRVKKA